MLSTDQTRAHAQDIVDFIIENPEQHNQKYVWAAWTGQSLGEGWSARPSDENNICGTTLCVAGTSIYLLEGTQGLIDYWDGYSVDYDWEAKAAKNLGLDEFEAHTLFYTMENGVAFDALVAVASGDKTKFDAILDHDDDRYARYNI